MASMHLSLWVVFLSATMMAQANPVPFLNDPLVPTRTAPGGHEFRLVVNGTGFVRGSVVRWNGRRRKSQFINRSQLGATILVSDIATPRTASVTVVNPAPGGGASNPVFFQVASSRKNLKFSKSDIPSNQSINAPVVGDFNRDGILDAAVTFVPTFANQSSVQILLGKGDGTFRIGASYYAGISPTASAVGDFDHDGKLDLAILSQSSGLFILSGNGDGTFQPAVRYRAGTTPFAVAVGDFNRDGSLDLAVLNGTGNSVSIFLGKGDGTFAPYKSFPTPPTPHALTIGDFNGDGNLDLVVAGLTAVGDVAILLGRGDGTFAPYHTLATGGYFAVTSADFNGDGHLDLAVGSYNSDVEILLGNGDGTFQNPLGYPAGTTPAVIVVGDFNADGKLDLAVGDEDYPPSGVYMLLGNGNGTFQSAVNFSSSSLVDGIAVGDFNGDGRLDLILGEQDSVGLFLQ